MKKGKVAQLVNEAKVNQEKMNQLIREFDPLIKNYCKKLYFCEKEDAQQELTLAIIEAVRRMISCESEGGCIMYISNAVKYKYISLCKKNIIKENIEDVYSDVQLEQVNKEFDDYRDLIYHVSNLEAGNYIINYIINYKEESVILNQSISIKELITTESNSNTSDNKDHENEEELDENNQLNDEDNVDE